ncbi:amino acid racemase [Lapidilactobacillus gannanensis]|jgi:aspartate racemase|uniref:Amino acid racemase n=1 Tax=Lapidilactobacillus gannanensis TaxID=2486002 RepID=A0ABW4BN49_9LACO|nr:amino acid racemase [Lapidilactobacillus gannanensis]MCH4056859.1 amino acid racemase [Lactobacillaceae bacterium]
MKDFFTIIGGMGTMATESYLRLLNQRTPAHRDQDYLNYLLVNHATVPDRTSYILDHAQPNFFPELKEDLLQQSLLQPEFFVMVCNTAHYFYNELQALTEIPLLHMPRTAISYLQQHYPAEKKIGLIATAGTIADHVYENEIKRAGFAVEFGDATIQPMVNELIYQDIKEKNIVDHELYHRILKKMHDDFGVNVIVLGCTELSLAQEKAPDHPYHVIDAQSIIADQTLFLAQQLRAGKTIDWAQAKETYLGK